ncbi:MAG: 3-oxoacyl-ACP reductase family protein [Chloroflexota bacterium]|nr:3-oxoacyl-ACP reductase FabG [Chloroflexota bacterium]
MSMPSLSMAGKVAIVTGSSRGIGKGIALMFAEAGADVVVCSRNLDGKLELAAEEVRKLGRRSLAVTADVANSVDIDNLVKQTMAEFGAIDVLVNNAGTGIRTPVLEHSEEDWDKVLDTNLKSCFLLSRAVGKIMMEQKRGNIINIASMRGIVAASGRVSYTVSKAGIIMLTRVLALEFAPYIRVNAIAPGWIMTELTKVQWQDPKIRKEIDATIPIERWATVEEMASVALFLASDASSYVTGHTLVADGGISTT